MDCAHLGISIMNNSSPTSPSSMTDSGTNQGEIFTSKNLFKCFFFHHLSCIRYSIFLLKYLPNINLSLGYSSFTNFYLLTKAFEFC